MDNRILVLTSCTSLKDTKPTPAEELYQGDQHKRLMRGVRALREATAGGGQVIEVYVVSAQYGLVPGDRVIAPYDTTFREMPRRALRKRAYDLRIPQHVGELLRRHDALKLILLGEDYLDAAEIGCPRDLGGPTTIFCGTSRARALRGTPNLEVIALGNREAQEYGCSLVGLKGELAARILEERAKAMSTTNVQLGNDR